MTTGKATTLILITIIWWLAGGGTPEPAGTTAVAKGYHSAYQP